MEEVFKFLKEAGTYYISTINDGKPDTRPFGTVNIYEGKIYIQTGKIKKVYEQIIKEPSISICAMNQEKWIRINANAIEDDSIGANKSMLDNYPQLQSMYKPGDGNCTAFYLKDVIATISSFTEEPVVIKF